MKDIPSVSIIMNCFNGETFLKQAIDSVIKQTYKDWELIFWDNLSTDNSSIIVNSYKDHRIKYFKSEKHTLLGEARNLAFNKAKAEWVAFLDVDDIWLEDKLEKQIELIRSDTDDIGFIYGRCEFIYSDDPKKNHNFKEGHLLPVGNIFDELLFENFIPFVSAIVNKKKFSTLGGFDNQLKHSTDYYMFLRLSEKYPVKAIQEICCSYRIHDRNLTNTLRVQGELESISIVSYFLPNPSAKKALAYHNAGLAIAYLREGQMIKFLHVLTRKETLLKFLTRAINALKKRCSSK